MAFLNPLLLFGLAVVIAPILIHALARRPSARTSWAAMRFLKIAVAQNQKRITRENRILLLLRCAFLVLIALALARPAWRHNGSKENAGGDVAVILLLDQSASMAQTDGVTSRFAKAQQAAEQVLDTLPAGATVAVWLVSDGVKPIIPEPVRDQSLARQAIRSAIRSDRGSDWQPAIQRALDVLALQKSIGKQLYVITDGQTAGWKALEETAALLSAAKEDVQTRLVVVGDPEHRNLAVTGLGLLSAISAVGEPLRFEMEVSNFGMEKARNVTVRLAVDTEAPADEQTLESIAPGESKKVPLSVSLRAAGVHTITARIPADRAPADDARTIALHGLDKVNVLLVDGDPGMEPRESEVFHLRNALAPVPPEQREKYFIKTKTISPAELETQNLADYEAVMLADVAEVSEPTLAAFEKYLRAGGGLVIFPGPQTNTALYNSAMHTQRGFLPAAFADLHGNAEQQEQFVQLQPKTSDHPIVVPLKDPSSGNLGTAHFLRTFTLAPGPSSGLPADAGPPALVLSYADGQPAVMERSWGRGRVVQFSSTASAKWNDLGLRPVYVPFMQRVLGALLARRNEPLNGPCGAKFIFPMALDAAGREVRISQPGSDAAHIQPVSTSNDRAQLEFDDTGLAGRYEARLGDEALPFVRFATQENREESKLAGLSGPDLKTLETGARVLHWAGAEAFRESLEQERAGVEFWLPLAVLGIIAAIGETVLGNTWSRPK